MYEASCYKPGIMIKKGIWGVTCPGLKLLPSLQVSEESMQTCGALVLVYKMLSR